MKLTFKLRLSALLFFIFSGAKTSLAATQSTIELEQTTANSLCSENWYRQVERQVFTQDEQGHGPDLGSMEWRSVIEFKLKICGNPEIPARDTQQWCEYIDTRYISPR